jgi:uncharacterized membrane protein
MFTRNESTADRIVRTVVGAALLAVSLATLGLTSGKLLGIVAAVGGAILLLTAAIGMCPLYRLLHIDTSK